MSVSVDDYQTTKRTMIDMQTDGQTLAKNMLE